MTSLCVVVVGCRCCGRFACEEAEPNRDPTSRATTNHQTQILCGLARTIQCGTVPCNMQQQYRYSTGTGTVDSTPVVSWQRTRKACSSFVQLYSLVQYMYRVMYRYSRGPFAKSFPEGAFCKKSGGRGPIANRRSRKGAFYGFPIRITRITRIIRIIIVLLQFYCTIYIVQTHNYVP